MKKTTLFLSILLVAVLSSPVFASSAIYKVSINKPVSAIYEGLKEALEEERMFVVFEPNIGRNISGFAKKWGDNYNRNKLSEIRSLIFCNGWFANEVSNLDPDMLALCPLKITLTEKKGNSTALFVLPSVVAGDSPAKAILKNLEDKVKAVLTSAGFK